MTVDISSTDFAKQLITGMRWLRKRASARRAAREAYLEFAEMVGRLPSGLYLPQRSPPSPRMCSLLGDD
jgi:hypothetical protein